MRAKFTTHGTGSVTVEYTDPMTDIRECRTFTREGRYVYELLGMNGRKQQVCDHLYSRGSTLMVAENGDLLPIIRREYTRLMRALRTVAKA